MGWQDYLDTNKDRFEQELLDFVRIPSVSARPEHMPDVERAADWVAERLRAAGIENVEILPTTGHPAVYGDWLHAGSDKPTVLVYGHFDVQPAEPLDLWTSPPFAPEIRDCRVWGRGASDDKGGMLIPILSAEALLKETGRLPVNVKFIFEGQEEIGSPDMPPFIAAERDRLACDMIFSADGLQWSGDEAQIVMGLKGLVGVEVTVDGPATDQHSGLHGGGINNPLMALSQILASMKDAQTGRITIDGFYDDVLDLTDEDRAEIARVPFDEADYLAETGAPAPFGEEGYSVRERLWARPTLEVNGLTGGYQGAGSKTVLPARASAKITCRLVGDQDPDALRRAIRAHVEARLSPDAGVRWDNDLEGSRASVMNIERPEFEAARGALSDEWNREAVFTGMGGSIPVVGYFRSVLGLDSMLVGFANEDDAIH
ncbi:dipeptidase, partial [Cribrihabitans sp. XS_ASV171]